MMDLCKLRCSLWLQKEQTNKAIILMLYAFNNIDVDTQVYQITLEANSSAVYVNYKFVKEYNEARP